MSLAPWAWVPSNPPKTLVPGQQVLEDWRELDVGNMVWWYSDGNLMPLARQVMRRNEDEALLGDPDDIGKPGYRGQEVHKYFPDDNEDDYPTRGHALIPVV